MHEKIEKYYGKILLIFHIIVLLAGCLYYISIKQNEIAFEQIPLYSWGGIVGENFVDESYQNAKFWFAVDTGVMRKGVYYVTISYETDSSANSISYHATPDKYKAIIADSFSLTAENQKARQEIWLNCDIENMAVSIDRDNVGYLRINSINISRSNKRSFTYHMLKICFGLLAIDCFYFVMRYWKRHKEQTMVILGLLAVFTVSSLGIFTNSLIEGHDIWFHLARIEGIKDGLLSGAFPVKIQPNWLNGYGFAVSTMYGEALLYIPALLRVFGMTMQFSYKFYQLLITLLTVWISYYSFYKISKDSYIGMLASAVYTMSNYRIGSVWVRSGVGEYSAMAFFPLVLLGVWYLLLDEETDKNTKQGWICLAIGYIGLIQTHILSCEIVTFFVAFVCLLKIRRVFHKNTFWAFCKAVITVMIANLWFLVPFLDYMREDFKVFGEKTITYIQRVGITVYQLLSIVTGGRGTYQRYAVGVNGTVPWSLGIVSTMFVLASVAILFNSQVKNQAFKRQIAGCLGLAVLSCFMSTNVFPWDMIASYIGPLKTLISSLRRPTRLMTVGTVLIAFLSCLVLMEIRDRIKYHWMKLLVLGLCTVCAIECLLFSDFVMRGNNNFARYDGEIMKWDLAISGAEYFYTGTNCLAALTDTEMNACAEVYNVERDYNQFLIDCSAQAGDYIECPMFYYRGYQAVDVDTGENFATSRGENNKLKIDFSDSYRGKIKVSFKEPWYWRSAEVISLVAFGLICGIWMLGKRKGKGDLSNGF